LHRLWTILSIGLLTVATARAQSPPDIIELARQNVSEFISLFSEVKCTEVVSQEKLTPKGKVEYREQSRFDYLVIADSSDNDLSLQESRLEEQGPQHKKNVSLLVTNGFATLLLVFHPYYQDSFQFSPPEEELVNGQRLMKVRFRHVSGKRTPSVLVLRGREYPLEMMGTAWIEPGTGKVIRMNSDLQEDMSDVGLRVLRSEVRYAPVHFRDVKTPPWLPASALIEVETAKQHWRNTHEFSNYQHFGVDTHASVNSPQDPGTHP
jgi:hypothetical protein